MKVQRNHGSCVLVTRMSQRTAIKDTATWCQTAGREKEIIPKLLSSTAGLTSGSGCEIHNSSAEADFGANLVSAQHHRFDIRKYIKRTNLKWGQMLPSVHVLSSLRNNNICTKWVVLEWNLEPDDHSRSVDKGSICPALEENLGWYDIPGW